MSEFKLELRSITKTFPGVKALDRVHFQLRPGEIHALMGENGAGKSTFIKVITGVHEPDEGEIWLDGRQVRFRNPREAQEMGIAAIYQHVTSYPDLSVTENIFMGHEIVDPVTKRMRWRDMHEEAGRLLAELGANIDPRTQMGALSVAQQQIVEIAKALTIKASILIMDEPTAALTARESEELYRIAESLRERGASIIFISHRLEDMYRLADRVTVFRDARYIGTWDMADITAEKLITAMVGREITQLFPKRKITIGEEVLRVEGLGRTGYFADVSFSVRRGEILGLTGLVGAGRTEVCQAIFGAERFDRGEIYLKGRKVRPASPQEAMRLGIGYLPEDRQKQGLVLEWGIGRNITLPVLHKFAKRGWLNERKETEKAKELAEKVNVKAATLLDPASSLSGGNQQKVVFAKLLTSELDVLMLDEPTKGVDVGAKSAIYEMIGDLAAQGYGIVLVSSEMPEIIGLCDRVVVMREGRVTATLERDRMTQEAILEAAMIKPGSGGGRA